MTKRAPLLFLLAPTLLGLAACAKEAADQEPTPVALVTTSLAAKASVDDTVTAYGAAEFSPDGEHSLVAPVEAVVGQILAPAGTRVTAGQAVVALKASPASQIDLTKARADAEAAAKAYDRAQRLRAEGLDSDADVETARAASSAAAESAKSLIARTGGALVLRATAAGVVESIALARGDQAAQGAMVAKIGTLTALRVRLGLDAKDAAAVKAGSAVRLSALAGGAELAAKVVSVDPRLDPQTRLASVIVAAPAGAFAPGQPIKGVIVLKQEPGATVIPRAAVLYDQEQPYVFVIEKAAAHRHDVKLGPQSDDQVAVAKGVGAGERVVVEGASALDDGMAVREGKAAAPAGDDGK